MKHRLQRRFMYLMFQGLRAVVRPLPLAGARLLGRGLGALAWCVLPGQRRLAHTHLCAAFGEQVTAARRRAIVGRMFTHLAQNFIEWLWLPGRPMQTIQRLVAAEGVEHLRTALAAGNGAIVVSAHFGNWELIPMVLRGLGFEGGVLARRLRYPEYESFLIGMRGERGVPTLARGSLKEVAKLLRANQIVGMMPDQDTDSLESLFVDFLGRPAHTPVGPAALSVLTGAPIVPALIRREGRHFRLVIEPPISAPEGLDRAQTMQALTQGWSDVVARYVTAYPDQWVWMHRRWKTQPVAVSTPQPAASHQTTDDTAPPTGRGETPSGGLPPRPLHGLALCAVCCVLVASLVGCGRRAAKSANAAGGDPEANQAMSGFTLTGYQDDGTKRWVLNGQGAAVEDQTVTIRHPDGVGFDPDRTAYVTASAAQIHQRTRHVRLEHDVTIHTSDGLWLTTPILHWMPDDDQIATDQPVRLETDHMLLRGYGATGRTELKQATVLRDITLVLNPSDHDVPGGPAQVTITCDGPLAFDYEHHIATFEQNVHVQDPNGDLYSDTLVAYLDPVSHTIRYAEAMGRVRIHQEQNTAVSERAVYEPAIGKITLIGRPSLLLYPSEKTGGSLSLGGLATTAAPAAAPPAVEPVTAAPGS